MVQPDGTTSFQALQNAFDGRADSDIVYYLFDIDVVMARERLAATVDPWKEYAAVRQTITDGMRRKLERRA